jgi:hypothetical protein
MSLFRKVPRRTVEEMPRWFCIRDKQGREVDRMEQKEGPARGVGGHFPGPQPASWEEKESHKLHFESSVWHMVASNLFPAPHSLQWSVPELMK